MALVLVVVVVVAAVVVVVVVVVIVPVVVLMLVVVVVVVVVAAVVVVGRGVVLGAPSLATCEWVLRSLVAPQGGRRTTCILSFSPTWIRRGSTSRSPRHCQGPVCYHSSRGRRSCVGSSATWTRYSGHACLVCYGRARATCRNSSQGS